MRREKQMRKYEERISPYEEGKNFFREGKNLYGRRNECHAASLMSKKEWKARYTGFWLSTRGVSITSRLWRFRRRSG